jgi:hypothetical protein
LDLIIDTNAPSENTIAVRDPRNPSEKGKDSKHIAKGNKETGVSTVAEMAVTEAR